MSDLEPSVTVERAEYVFTGYLNIRPGSNYPLLNVSWDGAGYQSSPSDGHAYRKVTIRIPVPREWIGPVESIES
jgi:hypothetical protein